MISLMGINQFQNRVVWYCSLCCVWCVVIVNVIVVVLKLACLSHQWTTFLFMIYPNVKLQFNYFLMADCSRILKDGVNKMYITTVLDLPL